MDVVNKDSNFSSPDSGDCYDEPKWKTNYIANVPSKAIGLFGIFAFAIQPAIGLISPTLQLVRTIETGVFVA